jgi:hypothetical protein
MLYSIIPKKNKKDSYLDKINNIRMIKIARDFDKIAKKLFKDRFGIDFQDEYLNHITVPTEVIGKGRYFAYKGDVFCFISNVKIENRDLRCFAVLFSVIW